MSKEELFAAKVYLDKLDQNKTCGEYHTIKNLIDREIRRMVILQKCNEREQMGYPNLCETDIDDIVLECKIYDVDIPQDLIDEIFSDAKKKTNQNSEEYER